MKPIYAYPLFDELSIPAELNTELVFEEFKNIVETLECYFEDKDLAPDETEDSEPYKHLIDKKLNGNPFGDVLYAQAFKQACINTKFINDIIENGLFE